MDPRRQLGAHYTGEADILKVLRGLVLDELDLLADAERGDRVARLVVLDPACGGGDFLVVALRELGRVAPGRFLASQLHGIEIDPAAAELARARLPGATIVTGNALALDWRTIVEPGDDVIVVGNPPFVGKRERSEPQKADMRAIWADVRGAGVLDYASCWLRLAARYMLGTRARCGFVITSSVTQGEQVELLWAALARLGVVIHFAHRSFGWAPAGSVAKSDARVHVVIVGLACFAARRARLFEYESCEAEPRELAVERINAYLLEGPELLLTRRTRAISTAAPTIHYGSFALDGGHFTVGEAERAAILAESPGALPYLRAFVGGRELLHGGRRWCIWLADPSLDPSVLESMPPLARAVAAVGAWRATRARASTRELAGLAHRFAEIRQPSRDYLALPTLSSERRRYVPIGFLPATTIASNQLYVIPDATRFEFGVLSSAMHMAWIRTVAGRLESRFRYSAQIVYNNFPWPDPADRDDEDRTRVETAAAEVLEIRQRHAESSLATLYDPQTMPRALARAHARLDEVVDRWFGAAAESSDRARAELLFARYADLAGRPAQSPPVNR